MKAYATLGEDATFAIFTLFSTNFLAREIPQVRRKRKNPLRRIFLSEQSHMVQQNIYA